MNEVVRVEGGKGGRAKDGQADTFRTETLSVGDLFSGDRRYRMPAFQRPYSWNEANALQLFEDVLDAIEMSGDTDPLHGSAPGYFLGPMIVVQQGPARGHGPTPAPLDVVDGQQRLVTLSALLACLRDRAGVPSVCATVQQHLWLADTPLGLDGGDVPRLMLREDVRDSMRAWVQTDGGTLTLPDAADAGDGGQLLDVIRVLQERVGELSPNARTQMVQFILRKCHVILIVAPQLNTAYRMFRSINARGQPLREIDLVRGEFLGRMMSGDTAAQHLIEIWEDIESRLGVDGLQDYVLAVLRILFPREKPHLRALHKSAIANRETARRFRDLLAQFLRLFEYIYNGDFPADDPADRESINRTLACLRALPKQKVEGWQTPVLLWLSQGRTPQETHDFLRRMDALCIGMLVLGMNRRLIQRRFAEISEAVIAGTVDRMTKPPHRLTARERTEVKKILNGRIAPTCPWIKPLLQRISIEMQGPGMALAILPGAELEHILPQRPNKTSNWREIYKPNGVFQKYLHRLGNLTLIHTDAQKRASNKSFDKKRLTYFQTQDTYALPITTTIGKYVAWTPRDVDHRHDELLGLVEQILDP